MLIEEIELLHIDLWNAKAAQEHDRLELQSEEEERAEASMERTLRARLSRVRHR